MTRLAALASVLAALALSTGSATAEAGTTLCVGASAGCFDTIQQALDASHDGDTIRIGRGTFAGGIVVTTSVRIVGRGASHTVIRGGGPVVTVGEFGAATEPTVQIDGVTITGGLTRTSPESIPFVGHAGVLARGGGIEIPPNSDFSGGATVTISRSVITGNRVEPRRALPAGPPCPGGTRCPFALAAGGGIDSWGMVTLVGSAVRGNLVGGIASDADGGGIASQLGPLTLRHSVVRGNTAIAVAPNGRFAEGGGLFVTGGSLHLEESVVAANRAVLRTSLPAFAAGALIDMNAHAGGIHVGIDVPTVIDHASITGNSVAATGLRSEPCAFDSAILIQDSPLVMRDTLVARNRVTARIATAADVGLCGNAFDSDGGTARLTRVRIIDNVSLSTSRSGVASTTAGLAVTNVSDHAARQVTVAESQISGNVAVARSRSGTAVVQGVGLLNNALLELRHVVVAGNVGTAVAPRGVAQGGGIWNGVLLSGPPVQLFLADSAVTRNVLTAHRGIVRRGAGLYATSPVRFRRTTIHGNRPDDCLGCG